MTLPLPFNTKRRKAANRAGVLAEWLACIWLMLKGYRLLCMRYKTKVGEIDLIMRRGKTIVFVEVKARRTHEDAAASIHRANQQRVMRAAQWFLCAHPAYGTHHFRFDVVTVSCYVRLQHVPNAFSL